MKRINALKDKAFREGGFDGFLILNSTNLTYITGFSGASALLVPRDGESIVYAYGVNYEHAKLELAKIKVELVRRSEKLTDKIARQAKVLKIEKLGVDALSIESWRTLVKSLGSEGRLAIAPHLIRDLRKVKDEKEIELMRKAANLTSEGMRVARETLEVGKREYEVAAEIEYAMRKMGSQGTAFETIVASGVCSAFPHGSCSDRKIQKGDLVVVDVGAIYKSYRSDMTRTFVVGNPSEKQKTLCQTVRTAQAKAFEVTKPNAKAADVDAVARRIITVAGYGKNFVHNLGHGVGLEVHEQPILSPESQDLLAAGNVVTLEPGIYLVGYGGIRVEDTVLVHMKGAEKLTKGTYDLKTE